MTSGKASSTRIKTVTGPEENNAHNLFDIHNTSIILFLFFFIAHYNYRISQKEVPDSHQDPPIGRLGFRRQFTSSWSTHPALAGKLVEV